MVFVSLKTLLLTQLSGTNTWTSLFVILSHGTASTYGLCSVWHIQFSSSHCLILPHRTQFLLALSTLSIQMSSFVYHILSPKSLINTKVTIVHPLLVTTLESHASLWVNSKCHKRQEFLWQGCCWMFSPLSSIEPLTIPVAAPSPDFPHILSSDNTSFLLYYFHTLRTLS